jgi:hypothetical protein
MRPPGPNPVVRATGAPAELSGLAAEFPGYEFATQQKWGGGVAIVARRHGGCAQPGLYVVVSDDLEEAVAGALVIRAPPCEAPVAASTTR